MCVHSCPITGDYDFWRETVSTYVHCRLSAPHTTTTDAREAMQGGVIMFTIIARCAVCGAGCLKCVGTFLCLCKR